MRKTQAKFTKAMQDLADERGLDLVVDSEWSNTGTFRFQREDSFEDLLAVHYNFQAGYSSFDMKRGREPRVQVHYVRGGEHDQFVGQVRLALGGAS